MNSVFSRLTQLFPFWAIIVSLLAWQYPELFRSYETWIVPLLSVVMFGMGLTLHLSDFSYVLQMPKLIFAGIALQYSIMPLTAVVLSDLLELIGLPHSEHHNEKNDRNDEPVAHAFSFR